MIDSLKALKAQMLKYEGVTAVDGLTGCGLPSLDVTVPTNNGGVTVEGIDEDIASGILMSGRGAGFLYHSELFFKVYVEDKGHEIKLIEKEA